LIIIKLSKKVQTKLDNLISFLKDKKIIVAFSGGVDSSLLAFLSKKYSKKCLLITENSILYPNEEIKTTKQFAQKYKIPHHILKREPLNDIVFKKNPINRCYICKKELYQDIKKFMKSGNYDIILDGSNLDDLSDYRPGIKALEELNISSPYIKFNINKQEIREISNYFDLDVRSKPSMACFSSRIPYSQEITEEKLIRISEAEKFLKEKFHINQLRVRHHENKLARIEFLPKDIPKIIMQKNMSIITNKLKSLGFLYITIDLEGFRSGSMNEILSLNKKKLIITY